jgi:hypothetical protein
MSAQSKGYLFIELLFEHKLYLSYVVATTILYLISLGVSSYHNLIFVALGLALIPVLIDTIKDITKKHIGTDFFFSICNSYWITG